MKEIKKKNREMTEENDILEIEKELNMITILSVNFSSKQLKKKSTHLQFYSSTQMKLTPK